MSGPSPPTPVLKIILIEDSPRLCRLLAGILDELEGVLVVGEAADELAALRLLDECEAHLAIIDLELGTGSGLRVLRALAREPQRFGRLRTVVFSNYGHSSLRECCRDLGADGFFDKTFQLDELIDYVLAARRMTAC